MARFGYRWRQVAGRSRWLSNRSRETHLGIERLETRIHLSATPLADYDRVSAQWFAAATLAPPAVDDAARWIVRLTPEAIGHADTVAAAAALLADLPVTVLRGLGLPGQLLVAAGGGMSLDAVGEALAASLWVASANRDRSIGGSQLANDPFFNEVSPDALKQYALYNTGQFEGIADADIDADLAWDISTGSSSVVVAVIDSGAFYNHPDLAANIWTNTAEIADNNIDDDGNGKVDDRRGWDFENNDNDPVDDHGHGTHVAGAIGAVGNNNTGVTGVNWATSILPVKFLDENNVGTVAHAVEAVNYVTMLRTRTANPVNVRVINASWGGAGADNSDLRTAIAAAGDAGILFVSAAGNGDVFGRGQNIDANPFFPASYSLDNMLVVAATDRHDELTNFSNYGATAVDIAAPGLSVWNTDLLVEGLAATPTYGVRSGTSMAAPLAAGTAALLWSAAPHATLAEVRDAILAGGDVRTSLAGKVASGRRLNAYGALVALAPQAATTSALDVTDVGSVGATSYQFTVSLTSNAGIPTGSIGSGDFVVRRKGTTGADAVATLVTKTQNSNPLVGTKQWTATYQVTPPGGSWDFLDGGAYEIVLVGGELLDANNVASRQKPIDEFVVDFSSAGVYRPTAFVDGGPGSLREAIALANAVTPALNPQGGFVILAPGTYTLSLAGVGDEANATGDLDVTGVVVGNKVTVASDGTGEVIIDAGGIDRAFDVLAGGALTLSGVTIRNGAIAGEDGGGIRNHGTLFLDQTHVENSAASSEFHVLQANSGEFFVNFPTISNSLNAAPAVSMNATGEAWVVYDDVFNLSSGRLFGQSYAPNSTDFTTEYSLVNIANSVGSPVVARDDAGNAMLAWIAQDYGGAQSQILAQRIDENGNPVGALLTPNATSTALYPSLATNGTSRYVVAWTDATGLDGSGQGVYAATYDLNGALIGGSPTRINLATTGDQRSPSVGVWNDGSFVVAYSSSQGNGNVYVNGDVLLSESPIGRQSNPRIAVSEDGFVAVWESDGDVKARRFNRASVPLGPEILVASTLFGAGTVPDVAMLPGGGFFVVWGSDAAVPGVDSYDVWGQQFRADGTRLGAPARINETVANVQFDPAVASDDAGNVLVVWSGIGVGDGDGGVEGRRFALVEQHAGGSGGGVYNAGTLTTDRATVVGNTADVSGGGLYNAGTLTVDKSTIEANSATAGDGGGVYNGALSTATITSSTISANSAIGYDISPIAYYEAEGNANDSINNHDGVLMGSTVFAAGHDGQAFEFDSTIGTRVEAPGLSGFQSQTLSIEAWVNANSVGSHNDAEGAAIVLKDFSGASQAVTSFAVLGPGNTGHFDFIVGFTDETQAVVTSRDAFAFGVWHHVAMTWDGGWLRAYVNGNLQGETFVAGAKLIHYNPAAGLSIGSHSTVTGGAAGGRRFDGRIDGVRLYDQALTDAELQGALRAGDGGGVYNAGTFTATNVTVSGNSAANQGGGIYNAASATATIASTTVTANSSAAQGAEPIAFSSDEYRLNGWNASGTKGSPEVVGNGNGRAFVVHESSQTTVYEAYGSFVTVGDETGGDFYVSDPSAAVSTLRPSSAMNANGEIVTVSQSSDGVNSFIEGRFHNALTDDGQGSSASGIFSVTAGQTGSGSDARVALNDAGKAVVVWLYDSGGAWRVRARRLTNFAFDGGSFPVGFNSPYGIGLYPDVAIDQQGNFAIVWGAQHAGDSHPFVYLSLYAPDGSPISENIRVSAPGTFAFSPRIERDESGMTIVWQYGESGASSRSYARQYDNLGNPRAAEFALGSSPAKTTEAPRLTLLEDGGFFAVWRSSGAGDVGYEVRGQRFSGNGTRVGSELQINQYTAGDQHIASVGQVDADTLLVAWSGNGATDPSGIYGRFIDIGYDAAGIASETGGNVTLRNTIVAENASAFGGVDVSGAFLSSGGNLIGNGGSATGLANGANGNMIGAGAAPLNPLLGPLADNGGPTKTHLPAAGSRAIDAGLAAGAPATDQRGVARPQDGDNNGSAVVDVGAVERYYASITGRKFKDQNQNGVQDGGESPLAGWTMFLDTNQNGLLDVGERSTVTDAQGDYAFTQLTPGIYTVAEVNQTGWTRTYVAADYAGHVQQGVGGVSGLQNVQSLTFSPDGRHAYAMNSVGGSPDSIVAFRRSALTGALEFVAAISNDLADSLGLEGEGRLVVSPDGAHVYALGTASNAVAAFARNSSTGQLTFVAKLATAPGPNDLAFSPDPVGLQLYVLGSSGSALATYGRNASSGVLTAISSPKAQTGPALVVASNGSHLYTTNGSNIAAYSRAANGQLSNSPLFTVTAAALNEVVDLVMSPDGLFLYALSRGDQSISVYQRTATSGALAFVEKVTRGQLDGGGKLVDGLLGGRSLAMSPAGDRLYATGDAPLDEDDSVASFRRDATTGRLSFLQVLKQFGDAPSAPFGVLLNLTNPDGVATSPDGTHFYVAARETIEGAITQFTRDGADLDRKNLLVGQDLTVVDFSSYAAPAEIRGTVYDDKNNDGIRDGNELGLANVVVYLDADGDNQYDVGESMATTNPLGNYAFTGLLAPAGYTVRLNLPTSQTVTSPDAAGQREYSVNSLAPNQVYVGADFLVNSQLAGVGGGQITGVVWRDLNGNGIKDDGEPFLNGRQVYLDVNDDGVYQVGLDVPATAPTSTTGNYSFNGLGVAHFVVRIVPEQGELTTTPTGNSFTKQSLSTGTNPVGLVSADFNGDGKPDLASVDSGADRVSIRLQQAGGAFGVLSTADVNSQPTGLAVGRFNDDAYPDLAVVHYSFSQSKVVFLINNGSGTFTRAATGTELAIPAGSTTVAAADFDNDGDDDLAVALDGAADLVFILKNNNANNATPLFAQVQQFAFGTGAPLSLAVGDLNADGKKDVLAGNFFGDSVQVLRNTTVGANVTFALHSAVTANVGDGPASVAIVPDLNADGFADAVVATIGTNAAVKILLGDGAGGLVAQATAIPAGNGPRSVAAGDADGDGDLDLVVGNAASNDVVVLRRTGVGADLTFASPESAGLASFASLASSGVKQVLLLDLDGNNVLDVAAVRGDGSSGALAVLNNAKAPGSRRFALASAQNMPNQDFGVTTAALLHLGDYDNDLDVDGADVLTWQRSLGAVAIPAGSGADGSANGTVDGADLDVWKNHFGQVYSTIAASEFSIVAAPSSASAVRSSIDALLVAASQSTWSTDSAAFRDRVAARDVAFAAGDFTQLVTEVRDHRPNRRTRWAIKK